MQPEILSLPFTRDVHGCSQAGAEKALPGASSQAGQVLAMIRDHGPVSDADLVELTGYPLNIINARRWQLAKQGHIQAVGVRQGRHGVPNTVWIAAEK